MLVDVVSSYCERRQGIRMESYWKNMSVANLTAMSSFMMAATFVSLWMIIEHEPGAAGGGDIDVLAMANATNYTSA